MSQTSLNLNLKQTAFVMIDLQHLIVSRPLAPHSGPDVVEKCARLARAVRDAGGLVVYVHVLVTEVLRLPTDVERPAVGSLPPNACDIVPEAGMKEGDLLVTKRQWGAFYATDLDQQLRRRGIRTIILGGISTNMGVESTARAAFDHGYEIVFASDAMSSSKAEWHEFSVGQIFPIMGRVRTTEQILEEIKLSS
jgi:nicotinamidase-related amidase